MLLQIKRFLFWFTLFAVAAGLVFGLVYGPRLLEGNTFRPGLRTLEGMPVASLDDIATPNTAIIVLWYWHKDCVYCQKMASEVQEFYEVHAVPSNQILLVYGVNVGNSERAVKKFIAEYGLTFPQLLGVTQEHVGVSGYPYTEFIYKDVQWTIIHQQVGMMDHAMMDSIFANWGSDDEESN